MNIEVARYSPAESAERAEWSGWNEELNYKDFQVARGIAAGGSISLDEAKFLTVLVKRSDPKRPIIEIGTLFGGSTRVLCLAKAKTQHMITVDNFRWNPLGINRRAHELATTRILRDAVENHNLEIVVADKDDFYRHYAGPAPGLVFLDANHDYEPTLRDIQWAKSVDADIISGHDYSPNFPGVCRAVDEMGGPKELVGSVFVL